MLNVKELIENISSEICGCCGCPKALDACDKAIAEIKDGGWADMASAPKDGTAILGYTDEGLIRVVAFVGDRWQSDNHCGDDEYSAECTNWMPLPDGPEDEG